MCEIHTQHIYGVFCQIFSFPCPFCSLCVCCSFPLCVCSMQISDCRQEQFCFWRATPFLDVKEKYRSVSIFSPCAFHVVVFSCFCVSPCVQTRTRAAMMDILNRWNQHEECRD